MAHESLGQMIGGVDTHKHEHVAAVIDDLGRIQGWRRSRRPVTATASC